MKAQPLRVDTVASPSILDRDGEVVFFEEAERKKHACARAVPAQIGKQNVVSEAESAHGIRSPFGRVATLPVNEKNRRPRSVTSRRGEDRGKLGRSTLASRMAVVGDSITSVAKSPYQVFSSRGAGCQTLGRNQPIG